jgi:hypothetical protein
MFNKFKEIKLFYNISLIFIKFETIFVYKAYNNKIFSKIVLFDFYYIEFISPEIKSNLDRDTE